MPKVDSVNLILTPTGQNVTIDVTYNVTFTQLERQLAGLGMNFHDHIDLIGVDPDDGYDGDIIFSFPHGYFPIIVGAGSQVIPIYRTHRVARASLQEDPADNDSFRCRVKIHTEDIVPEFSNAPISNRQVLAG